MRSRSLGGVKFGKGGGRGIDQMWGMVRDVLLEINASVGEFAEGSSLLELYILEMSVGSLR